ncbi:hypothetical protein Tco_1459000 [Tanacetum coccineum]
MRRTLVVPLMDVLCMTKLHFVEEPLEFVRDVKRVKRSRNPLVKVIDGTTREIPEFTWASEGQFKKKYPHS